MFGHVKMSQNGIHSNADLVPVTTEDAERLVEEGAIVISILPEDGIDGLVKEQLEVIDHCFELVVAGTEKNEPKVAIGGILCRAKEITQEVSTYAAKVSTMEDGREKIQTLGAMAGLLSVMFDYAGQAKKIYDSLCREKAAAGSAS